MVSAGLAALLSQLPKAAQQGINLAFNVEKQIRMRAGFENFDLEKVFWRTVYAEGILFACKIGWHLYRGTTFLEGIGFTLGPEFPNPIFGLGFTAAKNFFLALASWAGLTPEEGEAEVAAQAGDWRVWVDKLLIDYYPLVAFLLPLLFLFLEYRNYQRLRKGGGWFQ